MKHSLIEAAGWYGAAAIIGAYAMVSFGYLSPDSLTYQTLNLTGGIGIVIESYSKKAYPPAVLNTIWSIIGVIAIVRILL